MCKPATGSDESNIQRYKHQSLVTSEALLKAATSLQSSWPAPAGTWHSLWCCVVRYIEVSLTTLFRLVFSYPNTVTCYKIHPLDCHRHEPAHLCSNRCPACCCAPLCAVCRGVIRMMRHSQAAFIVSKLASCILGKPKEWAGAASNRADPFNVKSSEYSTFLVVKLPALPLMIRRMKQMNRHSRAAGSGVQSCSQAMC